MVNFLASAPIEFDWTLLVVGNADRMPISPVQGRIHEIKANPHNPNLGQINDFIQDVKAGIVAFDCLDAIASVKDWTAERSVSAIFDDVTCKDRSAQVAVNAILGDWDEPRVELPGGRLLLQGPNYLVVRHGIADARHEREFDSGLNVLIAIGGTDPARSTLGVVGALSLLKNNGSPALAGKKLAVNVLVSPSHPDISGIREVAASLEAGIGFGIDIGAALSWADVAITGGGVTAFEAMASGAVCLAIPNPESHEVDTAARLESRGAAVSLPAGESSEVYAGILDSFIGDAKFLKSRSEKGRGLMDGKGALRVWKSILTKFDAASALVEGG